MKKIYLLLSVAFLLVWSANGQDGCVVSIPYTCTFQQSETNCWSILDANNDGTQFIFNTYGHYVYYSYNSTHAADDWLFSPWFMLDGNQYCFFYYLGTSSSHAERFQVFAIGTSMDTIPLTDAIETSSSTYKLLEIDLTPLYGQYKVGIHCISDPDMYTFRLMNFNVKPLQPALFWSEDSLAFAMTPVGSSSVPQQVVLNSHAISSPISITASQQFEISTDGATFSSTVTLPANADAIANDTFYVRLSPTADGNISGTLIASGDMYQDTLLLSGSGRDCSLAATLPFTESFEGDFNHCWTFVNNSGFGDGWQAYTNTNSARSGKVSLRSNAYWDDYLYQYIIDNWLISQPITISDTAMLSFYIKNESYNLTNEHYSVYVSTTGNNVSDFTTELYADNTGYTHGRVYIHNQVSLADYVGQTIYLAFRHHTRNYRLYLDDITIATVQDHPLLSVSPFELDYETMGIGEEEIRDLTVSGLGLSGNITATVAEPFSLSTDGITYSNTATLPPAGGTLHVRFIPTNTTLIQQFATFTSPGADTQKIFLRGQGIECYNTIPYTHSFNNNRNSCWTLVDGNDDGNYFVFATSSSCAYHYKYGNTADDWLISPSFQFEGNVYGSLDYQFHNASYYGAGRFQVFAIGNGDTLELTPLIEGTNEEYQTLSYDLSALNGKYKIGIYCTSQNDYVELRISNFNIKPITPAISIQQDSLTFPTIALGDSSPAQQIVVTSMGIETSLVVTALTHFEVSPDGVNFSPSLILPGVGATLRNDTLYVRFNPTSAGNFSSMLTITGGGLSDSILLKGGSYDCNAALPMPFEESFEETNYCWLFVDQDGSGESWVRQHWYERTGEWCMKSTPQYDNYLGQYFVDNWLISPPIQLTDSALLTFYAKTSNSDPHFSVYLSTTGTDIADFTTELYNYDNFHFPYTGAYYQFILPLYEYAGQNVHIAFRHHNVTSYTSLYIDDISVATVQEHPLIVVGNNFQQYGNVGIGDMRTVVKTVEGLGLTGNITATVPAPYTLSVDGINYSDSVTLPAEGGQLYIRFSPNSTNNFDGTVTLSSPGASNEAIYLFGWGMECYNTIPYTHLFNIRNDCWQTIDANGDNYRFYFGSSSTTSYAYLNGQPSCDDWLISPALPLDGNQYGYFSYKTSSASHYSNMQVFAIGTDTVPVTSTIVFNNTQFEVIRFDLTPFSGYHQIGIRCANDETFNTVYINDFHVKNIDTLFVFQQDTLDFGEITTNTGSNPVLPTILSTVGVHSPIDLSVAGPYEISLNGVDYSTTLTIPATSAGVANDTILIRAIQGSAGAFSGMLTAVAGNLQDSVFLMNELFECSNSIPYMYSFNDSTTRCWTVVNSNEDSRTFEFNTTYGYSYYLYHSSHPADDWLMSPFFHLTGGQYGSFDYRATGSSYPETFEVFAISADDTVQLVAPMTINNSSFKTKNFDLSSLNGDYQIGIHCISEADMYRFYVTNFIIDNFVPTLTADPEQLDFGILAEHVISEAQQLVVNGSGVFAPITVSAPMQFEVSTDGVNFSGSVTIPARNYGFTSDTFYVRLNPTAEGIHDNPLIISSTNCADTVYLHGGAFFCEETYSLPLIEDFEDALTPCWHIYDYDSDDYSWIPTTEAPNDDIGHENTTGYVSMAYTSISYGIYQNNWLVTPMFVPTQNTVLAYYMKGTAGILQQYYVYVATENSVSAFLATEPILIDTVGGSWEEIAMSLADYAGDTVYVAFRHYGKNWGSLTIDDLVITDNLNHPVVLTDSSLVSFGTVIVGKNATRQREITTFGLSGPMVATTTAPFSLSVDGTTFASYANIPASGGTLYFRYSPTSGGDDNGTVTLYIPGGQTRTIAVSGSGFDCLNTIPYSYQFDDSYISCWSVENSNGDYRTFNFDTLNSRAYYVYHSSNAADDWLISPTFQFNGNQYGHFDYYCHLSTYPEQFEVLAIGTDTVLLVAPMEITNTAAQTLYLNLTGLSGEYAIAIHCISDADQYVFYIEDFNILNITPTISVDEDSLVFEMIPLNSSSNAQQLAISTIGIYTPITASVPLPFEISADNITFSNSVVLPSNSDLLGYDTLYVRFSPTSTNPAENTLTLTSGNAQATVALTGTSRDCDEVLSLPIFEGFEGFSNYCWNSLDQDGDGHYWYVNNTSDSHSGSQCAYSISYSPATNALYPDNWLVSQPIQLPELPARLSFWIKETDEFYGHEYYSVYISTTGNSTTDFTDVLASGYVTPTYEQQSISLREYAGQTVWIAFRHHNCADVYQLLLDDIDIRLDTIPQVPMVVTDSVFSITQMSAVCIGHTVFDGNATVTACGFVWGTSPNPTLADNVVNSSPSLPTMIGMLNGLSEHATYYVRAFATNSIGTEYGEEIMFTTLCGSATYTNFSQSACESFVWNDSTYFESGDYTQHLTNVIGCDSIVTMHLTIYHSDTTEFAETACESFVWNNVTYNQSGDYTQSFTNIHGCDSIVTLHLTIHHGNTSAFSATACESYVWNDVTYNQSGDYTQTLTNIYGCDSVVTLHLTVHYGDSTEFAATECESYTWNGVTYSLSGDYTQTLTNIYGCDSVVTLHLAVHYGDSTEFSVTECESYTWNDSVYLESGDYTQTFANLHGCDSIVTLHLTIHHGDSTEFAVSECVSFTWNDTVYLQSGDYTQTFANLHGCDSVVTLHLTLYPAVSNEETVYWPDSCYIWNGEEYCTSGDYTQTLTTVHGCDSTVTLHLTISVGVEDFVMENDLRVYPNPTNGVLQVSGTAFDEVQLFDSYGKLLGSWRTDGEITQIDLSRHAAGVYFVKALNRNQVVGVRKVLKR